MIDIHSHLIPGVDDGARNVEDTFAMLEEAERAGFTDVILTSHYLTDYYEPKAEELVFWKDKLQEVLEKNNKKIKLHSGMEVYISEELDQLLIELPMSTDVKYLEHIMYILETMGIKFILAHPERYKHIQKNPNLIEEYREKGCLIQCNYGSILGIYGKEAKKTVKILLKEDLVHFMGSDCHKKESIYLEVPKALKKIEKIIGKKKIYELTTSNAQKIINNEKW